MAKKTFLADLDLALNQILAARLENFTTVSIPAATAAMVGRVIYDTTLNLVKYCDGTQWIALVSTNDSRMTNARTPTLHVLATNTALGAEHTISGAAAGHVLRASSGTAANFQQLDHADLANKGSNTHTQIDTFIANAPTTYAPIAKGVTGGDTHDHNGGDGAQIDHANLANKGTNTHTQIDTHIGDATQHRQINDSAVAGNTTALFSADKILSLISNVNSTISGALIYKGGYDAAANSPLLDATPIGGIKQGWTYVVTTAGTFFAEDVQVGDMIIAKQDSPTTAAHWTVVNKNIPDIIAATESGAGIVIIATQAEVQAGTNDSKVITPLKLRQQLGVSSTSNPAYQDAAGGLSLPRKFSKQIGDGVALTYAVTHNLGSTAVSVSVSRVASPFDEVECEVVTTSTNVTTFNFNVAPTTNQFLVTIIG